MERFERVSGVRMARPKKYTDDWLKKEAKTLLDWFSEEETRFWLKDFAIERGYHPTRLDEFAQKSKEFSSAYNIAKAIQESRIVKGGLSGEMNAKMAIFSLKNVAGWRDTKDINLGGSVNIILERG